MKTPEDEAFEDIERRQGGGYQAKRQMAADKLYHSTEARWCENFVEVKHPHIENEIVRFYFTQPVQEPDALTIAYQSGYYDGKKAALATREWNFCERCGKRTKDMFTIHTCTPPQGDA